MLIIITGISKGIGKAIAEYFISKSVDVVGIGRRNSLEAPNLKFIECDLADRNSLNKFHLDIAQEKEIVLINNAGILGNINRISDQQTPDFYEVLQVNTLAAMQLSHYFSTKVKANQNLTIINISSGAGKRPIPSWASYCASKAAIDLFSQTMQIEEEERGSNTRIYSIAPGVVDTEMQRAIRSSKSEEFSQRQQFINYKESGGLISPSKIAEQIEKLIIEKPTDKVVFSLKELE